METEKGNSSSFITVGLFQGHSEVGKKDLNIIKIKKCMSEAKRRGADVVVFPELFTTGYMLLPHDLVKQFAEDKSGATFRELSCHAKETNIAVLYGYPEVVEKENEKLYYNSAQFIDKDGLSLANYSKTHLWIDEEGIEAAYTPGSTLDVFDFCGFKIGILICFDAEFSEAVSTLAAKKATVILAPTACPCDFDLSPVVNYVLPGNCYTSCVSMAFVNLADDDYSGRSHVYDHTGKTILSLDSKQEGVFTVAIHEHSEVSAHLQCRRPELYKELNKKS